MTEKLEDPSQLARPGKEIARMKTVLRQREMEARNGDVPPRSSGQAK